METLELTGLVLKSSCELMSNSSIIPRLKLLDGVAGQFLGFSVFLLGSTLSETAYRKKGI